MNAVEILRSKGLKKTAQRIMLINILESSTISLTESDIKSKMGDLYDRVTFYRTVQTLLDAEIIHRIVVDNIIVKYALNRTEHHAENHAHFFCQICHSVTCLEDAVAFQYNLPAGFEAQEYEVLIKGICNKCHAKEPNPIPSK